MALNYDLGAGSSFSPYNGNKAVSGFGGGGGGSDALSKMMALFGGGGGMFGLGDLATGGLFSAGGAALSGLAGLFGGPSEQEKGMKAQRLGREDAYQTSKSRTGDVFSMAKNRMGQSPLDPNQYLADYMQSMAPMFNKDANRLGSTLGLDSGMAQGAMMEKQQSSIAQFMLNAKMQSDVLKGQNDNMLMQLMSGLGRVSY